MRNNERLRRQIDNLFEAFRIDVREIDKDAEPFAFANQITPERR